MRKTRLISYVLITCALFELGIWLGIFLIRNGFVPRTQKTQIQEGGVPTPLTTLTSTPTPLELQTQPDSQFDWKIPEFPGNFNWIESTSANTGIPGISFDDKKSTFGEITVSGKIYKTTVTDKDTTYKDAGPTYGLTLGEILAENGWSFTLQYGNYRLMGTAGLGVGGKTLGYIKLNGPIIRTIVYSYTENGNWVEGTTRPRELKCPPCSTDMTIIVSDPVDIRNFLPK